MAKIKRGKVSDFTPDPKNANAGTMRGLRLLEDSLRESGAGRSLLADKNGVLIAGNKTQQSAVDIGLENAVIVETDGTEVVIVKRTDLDINTPEGRAMAYRDNRVGELDLDWSLEQIVADLKSGDLPPDMWMDWELEKLLLDTQDTQQDAASEWQGMPEYDHDDLTAQAAFTIRVFIKDAEDLAAFGRLIGKDLTGKKFVWFSKQPISPLHEVHDEK